MLRPRVEGGLWKDVGADVGRDGCGADGNSRQTARVEEDVWEDSRAMVRDLVESVCC